MTSLDEALRALEKVVELVDKSTKGPWAFMNEKFDDCLLAFGTDSLEYDAPPPWYSCWTNIHPDDGRALIAAVNFIREHGAAILSARQEVAPVESVWMFRLAGSQEKWAPFFSEQHRLNTMRDPLWEVREFSSPAQTSQAVAPVAEYQVRPRGWTEESGWRKVAKREFDDHGPFPGYPDSEWERRCLYTSPAQTSEARDAYRDAVIADALETVKSGIEAGHIKAQPTVRKVAGDWVAESVLDIVKRAIAAMCQEAE